MKRYLILILALLIPFSFADAEETEETKDHRGFVTDSPGFTNNSKTTPKGTYRVEAALFSSEHVRNDTDDTKTTTLGSVSFVAGVAENTELQLAIDGHKHVDYGADTDNGIGSSQFALKQNLIGNDGGFFSLSVMPNILYSGSLGGEQWSGGVDLPMTITLWSGWALAIMPEWNYVKSEDGDGSSQSGLSHVLGYEFNEHVGGFVQHSMSFATHQDTTSVQGLGVAYRPLPRLQFSAEFNFGNYQGTKSTEYILGMACGF